MQKHDLAVKNGKKRPSYSGRDVGSQLPKVVSHLSNKWHSERPPKLECLYILTNSLALLLGKILEPIPDRLTARIKPKERNSNWAIDRHRQNVPEKVQMSRAAQFSELPNVRVERAAVQPD